MSERIMPCPICGGGIILWVNMDVGVFASCQLCRKNFNLCEMSEIPVYDGYKIRKSTTEKVKRIWNRMAENKKQTTKGAEIKEGGETNG